MYILGQIIGGVSVLVLWLIWLGAFIDCWGKILGIFAAIILTPGVVVFPLLYWMIEGVFPTMYFVIWGISLFGLWLSYIGIRADEEGY